MRQMPRPLVVPGNGSILSLVFTLCNRNVEARYTQGAGMIKTNKSLYSTLI